jgi:hypothetical protein
MLSTAMYVLLPPVTLSVIYETEREALKFEHDVMRWPIASAARSLRLSGLVSGTAKMRCKVFGRIKLL